MIEVTGKPISPEAVVAKARTEASGCVVTYVGLIRNYSEGKPVASVEYRDEAGKARQALQGLI